MDFIRKELKNIRRKYFLKKLASRIIVGDDDIVSIHRLKLPNRDIYLKSATSFQKSIRHLLVNELKDCTSQEFNDVVLEIMGTENSTASICGSPILNELAIHFENIATFGLNNEQRKDLVRTYLPPVNCKFIRAPALNPEVKKAMTDLDIKQDNIIFNKQKQICSAIACLGEALTLLSSKHTKNPTVRTLISDSASILCDLQYNESLARRNYIISSLKGDLKKQLIHTKINGMLFGKDEAQSSKIVDKKNSSENKSMAQLATVLRKISSPRTRSPNRNPKSEEQMIDDSYDRKVKDWYVHEAQNSHSQKRIQSPSYRGTKNPFKNFIAVPLEIDNSKLTRSSKQINKRDSRQRARSPKQSKASTSSSQRQR